MGVSKAISDLQKKFSYKFNNLVHNLYPREVVSELNQRYNHRQAGQACNPVGTDVFEKGWDNHLILDAYHYDGFTHCSNLPSTTKNHILRGSTSAKFVHRNFGGKRLHDVVYVTANNWYIKTKDDIEAEIHVTDFVDCNLFDRRTSYLRTVADAARKAMEKYLDKRFVVHFMQPYLPFLDPSVEQFDHTAKHFIDRRFGDTIRETDMIHADVMQTYRENLDTVLEEIEPLLDDLLGKTVVTIDRDELFGDREQAVTVTLYRHLEDVFVDNLVKILPYVGQNGEREDIVAEQLMETTADLDIEPTKQNRRDLSYRT